MQLFDEKTQKYVQNPEVIGGFSAREIQILKANLGRLYKWGISNQKIIEEINKNAAAINAANNKKDSR